MTQSSTPVAHSVARGRRQRRTTKKDLLPVMALLGAVFGWVVAGLAVIIAAIVLLIG